MTAPKANVQRRRRTDPERDRYLYDPPRRAHCPSCGGVQCSYGPSRALYGPRVHKHMRDIATPSGAVKVWCDGGVVDLEADRAP